MSRALLEDELGSDVLQEHNIKPLSALERFKAQRRDDARLLAELKVQLSRLTEEIRKANNRINEMELEAIEIEDAIAKLEGSCV